ncbi:MAG TPA: hypothetical protein VJV79_02855 [Polyangiaceae bacterium]|nr:hypothetical protein [Polyangiaceae bacterium]
MIQVTHGGRPITGGMHLQPSKPVAPLTNAARVARALRERLAPENRMTYSNLVHYAAKAIGRVWDGKDATANEILNLTPRDVVNHAAYERAMSCYRALEAAGCLLPSEEVAARASAPRPAPRAASSDSRTYEQIAPAERSKLKATNRAHFDALRASWIERGQPFQVAT